ncbi:MAG: sodium:solute symporter family transporter [Planctomycetota bacterium]|jgi:SSS family solute:Na+ symporter
MNVTVVLIVGIYFIISLGLGLWVARKEKDNTEDYFLAGRKVPWYAVSMSMTGSNIGTEHFIGFVGAAYIFGMAPAVWEWGNFIAYSVLLWIFLPFYFRKKLYTISQFLEQRYSSVTRGVFAAAQLYMMVLGVLVPALYLGGRILCVMVLHQQVESINLLFVGCVVTIAGVTAAYCIYGGLLSVVWTDVLQVAILIAGGLLVLIIGVHHAGGIKQVVAANLAADPARLRMVHGLSHELAPWPGVLAYWLTISMCYVGTNQFYLQRCLGAKSEWDAKMGVIGCGFLKLLVPVIVVFPGLIAFKIFGTGLKSDGVYLKMIDEFLPSAGQGILLAALIAAMMSTVSSVLNSASTIWTVDVHKRLLRRKATEQEMVRVGKWATFVIIVFAAAVAPLLVKYEEGIFVYIQNLGSHFAAPISVIFLAAFLWRKAHGRAATFTLIFGFAFGYVLKFFVIFVKKGWIPLIEPNHILWMTPFMTRAGISFVASLIALILATYLIRPNPAEAPDPDCIWNRRWARLPEVERPINKGANNLMFWWAVMVAASIAIFTFFSLTPQKSL